MLVENALIIAVYFVILLLLVRGYETGTLPTFFGKVEDKVFEE